MKEKAKYVLLAQHLQQKIMEEEYAINEKLPQETVIAKAYNVSRITVRKALAELEAKGLIYRIQGSGTFVKSNTPAVPRDANIALEIIDLAKYRFELVSFEVLKADQEALKYLNLTEYDLCYKALRKILDKNDQVVAFQEILLPSKIIQGIRTDIFKASIYEFLQKELLLRPVSALRTFLYGDMLVDLLENFETLAEPMIICEQRSFLEGGQVFEWTKTYFKTKTFQLVQNIHL